MLTKERKTIAIMLGILIPFLSLAIYSYKGSQVDSNLRDVDNAYKESSKNKVSISEKDTRSSGVAVSDFDLHGLDGNTVRFSSYNGSALVVSFWATWCRYCVMEIPMFNKIHEKYKAEGLEIIAISLDKAKPSYLKSFVNSKQIKYSVFLGAPDTVSKFGSVRGLPTTFFVNRRGEIVNVRVGVISEREMESEIKAIL